MNDTTQRLTEDRAVTPVISTILMVAVVVILGAVVSTSTLGLANEVNSSAPQASFEFTLNDVTGDIIVTKRAGDTLNGDQLKFSGAALEKNTYGSITEWAGKDVRAGDSAAVDVGAGETLTLIWQSPKGGETAVLAKYDVPDDIGPTASIGSITANDGENKITINNIQFSRVTDEAVYVVVEKKPRNNAVGGTWPSTEREFSTRGGDLVIEGLGINRPGNSIRVTVYETADKSTELDTQSFTVGGGGIVRGGGRGGRR